MKRTTRATVLAVALLASAPLFAAGSGTSSAAGTHASMPEPRMAAAQDDCSLPWLPSTGLSDATTGLLPKSGSTAADSTEVDRRLNQAASCVRPLGLWNDEPDDGALPKLGYSVTAMATWQSSTLEGSSAAYDPSVLPQNAGR